jgi:FtsH-binding integral membrane protein
VQGQEGERPRLQVVLNAKRIPYYFIANIGIMMFLIVSLAFTMFALPVVQLADRLNVVMTLVLSAVAFKLLCAEQLPELPYLTALDRYVLWGLGVLCLMALECVVVEHLVRDDAKEWWDAYAGYTFIVVWTLSNVPAIAGTFSPESVVVGAMVAIGFAITVVYNSLETDGWWHLLWRSIFDPILYAFAE